MDHESHERHEKLLYPDEVFGIQGAVFAVYATFGPGFLEGVYQECLAIEFEARGIPFAALRSLPLSYRGRRFATATLQTSSALSGSSWSSRPCARSRPSIGRRHSTT